jgi:hypothetical protein
MLQLDELQHQLQKKLLGSSPAASAKPRTAAAPAASNAVTYTSAGSGPGSAACSDSSSYSDNDSLLTSEKSGASAPGTDRPEGNGVRFGGPGAYQRSDASTSTGRRPGGGWDGSIDLNGFGDSRSNARRSGSSLHQESGIPRRHGNDGAHSNGWREGTELEPSPAGAMAGSRQRAASRSGVRTAAAALAVPRVLWDAKSACLPLKTVQRLSAPPLCRTKVLRGSPVLGGPIGWL